MRRFGICAHVDAFAGVFESFALLPYCPELGSPASDKIEDSDYEPAFDYAIARERGQIDAIAGDPAAPTFDDTIVALEKAGQLLNWVASRFYDVSFRRRFGALPVFVPIRGPALLCLCRW